MTMTGGGGKSPIGVPKESGPEKNIIGTFVDRCTITRSGGGNTFEEGSSLIIHGDDILRGRFARMNGMSLQNGSDARMLQSSAFQMLPGGLCCHSDLRASLIQNLLRAMDLGRWRSPVFERY